MTDTYQEASMSENPTCAGHYVYALCDPRSDAVRYVGKCSGYLNTRFRRHLWEAANTKSRTRKLSWLRSLARLDLEPIVVLLEETDYRLALPEMERRWIARLRAEGADLTNMTDGGEGMPNPSPETREKLRARPQVGFPPQARIAARARLNELNADPVFREKLRAAGERRRDPSRPYSKYRGASGTRGSGEQLRAWKVENAKAMGAGNKGRQKSVEHRAKLAASTRRAYAEGRLSRQRLPASEETRAKLRAAWVRRKEVAQ